MRLFLSLTFFFCFVPFAQSAPTADESKDVARIEMAGGDVTVDESLTEPARLRVTFKRLDGKTATALRGNKRIAALIVEDASAVGDPTMATIGTLSNLRELSLFQSSMTNAGLNSLKGLKELRKLYLIDAKVSDAGVSLLKGNDRLEELDLSGTMITSAAGTTFKTLTDLKLLAVNKTRFGDAGAVQLKGLTDLKKLEAVAAEISEKAAKTLEEANKGLRVRR
jgi:Leucine-rich repeat (LRR) protein